jgi:hypothetical protein
MGSLDKNESDGAPRRKDSEACKDSGAATGDGNTSVLWNVRIRRRVLDEWKASAAARGLTVSELIRHAVDDFLCDEAPALAPASPEPHRSILVGDRVCMACVAAALGYVVKRESERNRCEVCVRSNGDGVTKLVYAVVDREE